MSEDSHKPSLPQRFFSDIREISLGQQEGISLSAEELALIAGDLALLTEFAREFENFSQDPDTKLLIFDILEKLVVAEEHEIIRCESNIKLIDIYPARVSGGAVLGGVGAILYGTVAAGSIGILGPAVLALGGLIGLSACVWGRLGFAKRGRDAYTKQRHYEQLLKRLHGAQKDD